jgi:hypothetical protein
MPIREKYVQPSIFPPSELPLGLQVYYVIERAVLEMRTARAPIVSRDLRDKFLRQHGFACVML